MKLSYLHTSTAYVCSGRLWFLWSVMDWCNRFWECAHARCFTWACLSYEIYQITYFYDCLRFSFVSLVINCVVYIRKHCSKYEPVLYLQTKNLLSVSRGLKCEHSTQIPNINIYVKYFFKYFKDIFNTSTAKRFNIDVLSNFRNCKCT
jgi:hypothetical protein